VGGACVAVDAPALYDDLESVHSSARKFILLTAGDDKVRY
jgi:hypothetical protein